MFFKLSNEMSYRYNRQVTWIARRKVKVKLSLGLTKYHPWRYILYLTKHHAIKDV
jgi:hypothetical protein